MNRGIGYSRTKNCNREKAFADAWEGENRSNYGMNFGYGVLQDLFMQRRDLYPPYATHVLSNRERMIAATAVQWLGTNCGWCWLGMVLDECGYTLKEKV